MPREVKDKRFRIDVESHGDLFPGDLSGYAAADAARTLAENWNDALHDGTPLKALLPDVGDVIKVLCNWRDNLAKHGTDES